MTLNPNIGPGGILTFRQALSYMTERELIIACQKKEASAERLLVDRFAPMLLTVARRYVPDLASAEDVLQDAYIKIFKAIQTYDPDRGTLEAWMRKIVINTALQRYRKRYYKDEVSGLDTVEEPEMEPKVYGHLGAEELLNLIANLPDVYRMVFNLFVMEGLEHSEIGKMLSIATGSSRSRLQRARKMLQKQVMALENRNYEPREI